MEFIQCPHCQKQYAANDKLRAAIGKKIRCKHCKQIFEINIPTPSEATPAQPEKVVVENKHTEATISKTAEGDALLNLSTYKGEDENTFQSREPVAFEDSGIAEAKEKPAPFSLDQETADSDEETDKSAKKATAKTKPAKKTLNIQLLITIVLATVLLIAAVAAYLFLTQPGLLSAVPKKTEKSIVTEKLFKPIEIKIAEPKPEPVIRKEPVRFAAAKREAPMPKAAVQKPIKPKQKAAKPFKPSQVCKDVSAEYWVRSNRLATASLDTATYMKLLDQNLVQADEIRGACKDKTLVGIISKAARTDNRLDWIKQEINIVLDNAEVDIKKQNGE